MFVRRPLRVLTLALVTTSLVSAVGTTASSASSSTPAAPQPPVVAAVPTSPTSTATSGQHDGDSGSGDAADGKGTETEVLIGGTIYPNAPRQTIAEELEWFEANIGVPEIRRVFDPAFKPDFLTLAGLDIGRRATHYSFKPDMAQLAAGTLDAQVNTLLDSIPAGHRTMLTIWHEPEDNFTTPEQQATYRAGWQRFADLVHATGRPELTTNWTMMSYTWWTMSHRNPMDWYPGDGYVDSVGIDTYNEGSLKKSRWDSPGRGMGLPFEGDTEVEGGYVEGGAIRWAQARGLDWGVAEFGTLENEAQIDSLWANDDSKGRWVRRAVKFYVREGASYVEYFHCGPYRGPWWLDSSTDAMASFRWALEKF